VVSKKNVKMKIVLSIGLIFTFFSVKCQNVYSTIELGKKYTISQVKNAVNNANWCGYYHKTENCELVFEDGTSVFLKSKNQLIKEGSEMVDSCYQSVKVSSEHNYSISDNGVILIRVKRNTKNVKSNRK
jgi:hypothetical protein